MNESVYTCTGPHGRAEVLPTADGHCMIYRWHNGGLYMIYRWHNGRLYIEGAWSGLEDACKCARAVTGCEPSGTAG